MNKLMARNGTAVYGVSPLLLLMMSLPGIASFLLLSAFLFWRPSGSSGAFIRHLTTLSSIVT